MHQRQALRKALQRCVLDMAQHRTSPGHGLVGIIGDAAMRMFNAYHHTRPSREACCDRKTIMFGNECTIACGQVMVFLSRLIRGRAWFYATHMAQSYPSSVTLYKNHLPCGWNYVPDGYRSRISTFASYSREAAG